MTGRSHTGDRPTACIFSLTPVTDEPRVLRQSQALHQQGWNVVVVGYTGRQRPPGYWRFIEVAHISRARTQLERLVSRLELTLSRFSPRLAEEHYWQCAGYDGIREQVSYLEGVRCDLAIAHDYFTAPLAAFLADLNRCPFVVDIHEYSRGQYMHDARWRRVTRPWVHAIQKRLLPQAAIVTTVCDGIADLLHREYRLKTRPIVVRSTPFYEDLPFRKTNPARVVVLYHGILAQMRGLEEAIASVPLWRPEFSLVIRGPGPEDYVAALQELIHKHGVSERVVLDPPVAAGEMVREANKADIGFFIQPDISPQKRFTLPNKFFEYIMARTALCVADLPEMARIVRQFDLGHLVSGMAPENIASCINSFTAESIDNFKRQSMKAACTLCWEREAEHMLAAYETVTTDPRSDRRADQESDVTVHDAAIGGMES